MSWTSRVIWEEGTFLRAQHFQQQDRWMEQSLKARVAALGPYWWGVSELAIDRGALSTGRVALHSASGVFPDGTSFSFPGGDADEPPPPLDLGNQVRDTIVYLALPSPAPYTLHVYDSNAGEEKRLTAHKFETTDTHSGSPEPADLVVGRLRLRLLLEEEDRAGFQYVAVARVTEVAPDRRVTLDDRFIPPALCCRVAPQLSGFVTDLIGMINQRSEELAGRMAGGRDRGAAEQADFLLLQASNRWLPLLRHWAGAAAVHPEQLYATLVQMAGEYATFIGARRASEFPPYRHEDLQATFAPVIADLRRSLSSVAPLGVTEIPLVELPYGVRRGTITDRAILQSASFYLVVRATAPGESLRRLFPTQVKIGAIEQIRELINVAVPGIAVRPLPVAPRQLPFLPDANYFELDRGSPHWAQMRSSAAFGIHVSNEFPDLRMQLWAVRA